jgi:DNA-binding SARP family transcriptional activator
VSDWIEALPAALRASDPWLESWYGRAGIFVQPQRGRPALERAFEAFRAAGDLRGQALAASTVVTGCYHEWDDFRPLDRWLVELDRILNEEQRAALDRESELRARAARLVALPSRRPREAELAQRAAQLDAMVDGEPDVNVRVMAASVPLDTYNWTKGGEVAAALVGRIEPVVAVGEVAPLMQVWWRTHVSFWHYIAGRYDASTAVTAQAREIAAHYGLEAYQFEIDFAEASALVARGELATAKAMVAAIERRLPPTRRMDRVYLHYLRSMLAQHLGRFAVAVEEAEHATALAREVGLPVIQVPQFLMRLAHARGAAGDRAGAAAAMDEAIALAPPAERAAFERQRELLQIDDDIAAGRAPPAAPRRTPPHAAPSARGRFVLLRHRSDVAARLADFARAQGIEAPFVHQLIERNHLAPPAAASPAWPFRLRVHLLGRFALERDGQAMQACGKTQQRPLDLLKFVAAMGHRDVDSQQAMAALWPDADGAAAKTSFDTALFRLRKLLGVEQAITLAGGRLALSAELVWTDVRAFEAAVDAGLHAVERDDAALAAAARRLLAAYPGALLGDDDAPWIAKPRDALRARFTRTLARLGEQFERRRQWDVAADLYRRGLEADNLSESFYRGLMRALAARGEVAEALTAYRRCRELLSIVLGVRPASETERLHRSITAGALPT